MGQSERNYSVDGHLRRVKIDCSTDHVQTMNISMVAYNELDGHKLLGPKHRAEIKNLCGKTIGIAVIDLNIQCGLVDDCLCERRLVNERLNRENWA